MTIQIYQPSEITEELALSSCTKNAKVMNTDGNISFGLFPANNYHFPEAEIHLKLGYIGKYQRGSRDPKGAFGLRHIYDKHKHDIGISNPNEIPEFIESIIIPGADVIIDKNKSEDKPLIIESSQGLIALGLITPNGHEPYFSIITAYNRKSHPGIVIGSF